MPDRQTVTLERYRGRWPADDPDAGFRQVVAEYSAIDPMPTLEELSRRKGIPVGALVAFVLARYCASGSEALLYVGPVVVRQMDEIVQRAEASENDAVRLDAYRALAAIVSWLKVPLVDRDWRPGGGSIRENAHRAPECQRPRGPATG